MSHSATVSVLEGQRARESAHGHGYRHELGRRRERHSNTMSDLHLQSRHSNSAMSIQSAQTEPFMEQEREPNAMEIHTEMKMDGLEDSSLIKEDLLPPISARGKAVSY